MTVNRHGNGLPEKPTAHQAGRRPYDNFIIMKHDKREQTCTYTNRTDRLSHIAHVNQLQFHLDDIKDLLPYPLVQHASGQLESDLGY